MISLPNVLFKPWAAVVGVSSAALLLALLIASPIIAAFGAQENEIETALLQLQHYKSQMAGRDKLTADSQTVRERGRAMPGVLSNQTIALAQAQLQTDVKGIVEANKGEVRSVTTLPSELVENFDAVLLQYDLAVPASKIRDTLYALETRTPYIFIDQISIAAPGNWTANDAIRDPKLDVRWTLRSYRWKSQK